MNLVKLFKWLLIDQFRLYGGGGGGGDGGAAEREALRQDRIAKATEAVNALFGVGPRTAQLPTGQRQLVGYQRNVTTPSADGTSFLQSVERISPLEYAAWEAQRRATPQMPNMTGIIDPENEYLPVWGDVTSEQITTAGQAADARQQLYESVRDDTRNFFSQQLGEDKERAAREMGFRLARAGTHGSSQAIDMNRDFTRANDRGLLEVANRADSAASDMKSSDEQARLGLISKIVGGLDQGSAVSSAISQMQSNAEIGRQQATAGRMGNVFSDLLGGFNASQQQAGAEAARRQWENQYGNVIPNNSQYNGKVS